MHKVSRTLLLAGVMAFGTLTAACGDKVQVTQATPDNAVQSVTVSPQNASIAVGQSITLASNVTSTGTAAKTVAWTTSSAAVATVDATTGKVIGVSAGTVTITATATADASKAAAAAIVVTPTAPVPLPSIAIASVLQGGTPVVLGNASGQLDIAVNNSGGGQIDVYLSSSCATNTISATDTPAATQTTTSAQPGTVVLSVNTAAVTASNAPKYANGNYCIKARLTSGAVVVVATNTTPITLNNANQFNAAISFATITGGATQAVSGINGLNYSQGTMTVKLTPIIFTSTSQPVLISGYFTRNGQAAGAALGSNAVFTNVAVTAGVATIVFTDSVGAAIAANVAGNTTIAQYTSAAAGDVLHVTSATDAAGNSISINAGNDFTVPNTTTRIDNDAPSLGTATFAVVAGVNGYIGANYSFATAGTTNGSTIVDTKAATDGSGGVTTTYYTGQAGTAAFTTANSCNITGLTASTTGNDLANQVINTFYASKVVVKDKLGNQICKDVTPTTFGVDKIVPLLSFAAASAQDQTGYNTSAQAFQFTFSDTISGFNPLKPLQVLLVRNGFATQVAGECVIGTFNLTAKTCTKRDTVGTFSISNAVSTNGYYTLTANAIDQAAPGNVSATLTRVVALDTIAPAALTGIANAPVATLVAGTATISGNATDNLNLVSARANLFYAGLPNSFARATQTLGAFGGNVTSSAFTVALPTIVYTGMQTTTGTGVINPAAGALAINAVGVIPQDSISATDIGGNVSPVTVGTFSFVAAGVKADTLVGFDLRQSSSVAAAPATSQASTTLSVVLIGTTTNLPNQPFVAVDFYKVVSGRLVLVGTQGLGAVTDTPASVRTWTFNLSVPLTAAATNTFYAVARNTSGNAIITNGSQVVNP